jgi:hypothetical protein
MRTIQAEELHAISGANGYDYMSQNDMAYFGIGESQSFFSAYASNVSDCMASNSPAYDPSDPAPAAYCLITSVYTTLQQR